MTTESRIHHQENQELPERTLAWLGPRGTFTEQAAKAAVAASVSESRRMVETRTIGDIFEMVRSGEVDYGIVPIDNSTAGPVKDTLLGLEVSDGIQITEEYVLPIVHTLYMQDRDSVQVVASKDQALLQCEKRIEEELPGRELRPVASTAYAVQMASEDPTVAAIGSSNAAEALGVADKLQKIEGVQDNASNATTFVIIQKNPETSEITGNDKTTFIIDIPDTQGSLYSVLRIFEAKGVNLTKIKSLTRKTGSAILFLISIDGHEKEEHIKKSLDTLKEMNIATKSMGSYPKAEYIKPQSSASFNMEYAIKNIQKEAQNGNGIAPNEIIMVFTLPNVSGALSQVLKQFMERGINLTKIDSQPSGKFEEYIFYLRYQNNTPDKDQLIKAVAKHCQDLVLLNS